MPDFHVGPWESRRCNTVVILCPRVEGIIHWILLLDLHLPMQRSKREKDIYSMSDICCSLAL